MKVIPVFFLVISLSLGLYARKEKYCLPVNPRIEKIINTNWVFNYFPENDKGVPAFEMPSFDDSRWQLIAIPHTWQTFETTGELHPYIRNASSDDDPYWWNGWGCYRKHVVIGDKFKGKNICLEFEGVQKYCKVYLNGKYLGDHKGGYTSFYVDATDAVKFGEDNLLAVAVNNSLKDPFSIPPMNAGNFDVYGGIHRDVRLVIREKVNIPFQGSWQHEGGTFVTTPVVQNDNAEVNVKTWVRNNHASPSRVRLVTVLTDSSGVILDRLISEKALSPGELAGFTQLSRAVTNPHLWSPDNPYLYRVYSEVYDGNKLSDLYTTSFGIRSFHWDFDLHRLVLNDTVLQLHGINRHEEYTWLGAAFPGWIAERDMEDIRNGLEVNFMRTAHYPQDPSIYDFTDRHGICINEELPNIKKLNFNDTVQERNCREMIRRDRNHPSILFWSMGNETTDACDSRFAIEEDTTRILTVRQPYNESYNPRFVKHTDKEMPLESFLRCTIRGWYDRDDKDLEPEDNQWAGTEEWQHTQSAQSTISDHNGAVWLYADHGADREYVNAPLKHVNPKGWVDSWRNPKYTYYQWQANFAKKPMVFIHPHFWRKVYLGQKKDFIVDSNCKQVELFVNGKSKGIQYPEKSNNYCVTFKDVLVEEGILEARAVSRDGVNAGHRVVMSGEPYALTIVPSTKVMASAPDKVAEFRIDITDRNGVHVIGANNALKFKVEGPGRLVGPDVYISDRDQKEAYEGTMYIDAPVTNLVRAVGKTGTVRVTVSSPGLRPATAEIEIIPYADHQLVSGIEEPVLSPEGREKIAVNPRQANFLAVPEEIKPYQGEIRFPATEKERFRSLLQQFLIRENPGAPAGTVDFGFLLDALADVLNSTVRYSGSYGYIVADDYNFLIRQYNLSRAITKNIEARNLPAPFKKELESYYAGQIVGKGNDRNFHAENALIDQIPEGGKAVILGTDENHTNAEPVDESDLRLLIMETVPGAKDWDKETLKKVLQLIERINPYIQYNRIRDKGTKEVTESYNLVPGRVILLPDIQNIRKIKSPERKL